MHYIRQKQQLGKHHTFPCGCSGVLPPTKRNTLFVVYIKNHSHCNKKDQNRRIPQLLAENAKLQKRIKRLQKQLTALALEKPL